ncbi:MAG: MBL fold metallo-hydrolase [Akkermansiaceae bacterium]|jgi:glyoxylase-like metal-dependent hydrolase (beta-lactamase superfamily II)|nr:MBL fold metallo-hydrolase [Akkermansiaceae bacterium]
MNTRRQFLTRTGLAAAGLVYSPLCADQRDRKLETRNPWIYHFKIGEIDAWSISDGFMHFGQGLSLMYPVSERKKMVQALKSHREPIDKIPLYVNVLVIKRDKEVAIFDAGFGGVPNNRKGWLSEAMKKIGIKPEQITVSFLSHCHVDHIEGFVADGKPAFPNAALHITPEEFAFWRAKEPDFSLTKRNPKSIPSMVKMAKRNLEILNPQKVLTKVGSELLGGAVTVEDGFGHTPGHAIYRIKSGAEELLHIVDLAHHHLLMFQNPNWAIGLDNIPKRAVQTRKRVFAQAASERTRCYGFHLPYPGLGVVTGNEKSYQWKPERLEW